MNKHYGSTVLRTSLAAALLGLGAVAAVLEVRADLTPPETQRAARRVRFDELWRERTWVGWTAPSRATT